MKKIFVLTLLLMHLISLKCQQKPAYWKGLRDWHKSLNTDNSLIKPFIQNLGFKALGPNYVLNEILNKQNIPFIDSTFYITYSMPYQIYVSDLCNDDREIFIDTIKIRLKFQNGYCVSRNIKYINIRPKKRYSYQDIEFYETTETFYYQKLGAYAYNQRIDSADILDSYRSKGCNNYGGNYNLAIKFNYEATDSNLYRRRGVNYNFSKLNSIIFYNDNKTSKTYAYHLSQYSMGLNQGLIYLYDPIHKWQAYNEKYFNLESTDSYYQSLKKDRRSFERQYDGISFTNDTQFVAHRSVYYYNSLSNSFSLPFNKQFDIQKNKKIEISTYSLIPYVYEFRLKDTITEVLENSKTDILYNKQKELSTIKSKISYQFANGLQTHKTKSTINFISPYNIVETYYLKEGKSTKKFKINYIISR
jgi:hypothetical protein